MENYWYIGDIHGDIRLLDRLLDRVLQNSPSHIVFVGDYIDRGSHSRKVVDRIMGLQVPVTCLMGNHELMLLNAIDDPGYGYSPVELWYYNGGETTIRSFGYTSFFSFQSGLSGKYLDFFRNLEMSHVRELNGDLRILGIHGGISPAIPLEDHIRLNSSADLNRYILKKHLDPGESFIWVREEFYQASPALWDGYLVVHGHTPVLKLKRYIRSGGMKNYRFVGNDVCIRQNDRDERIVSIDIDSGSVVSGRLTGIGFVPGNRSGNGTDIRLKSITVSAEEIFPRDLGRVT